MGLAQFEPETWHELITQHGWGSADPFNPEHAIRAQAAFMSRLHYQFGGDLRQAFAAYNAGPGRVRRLINQFGIEWEKGLPSETKNYLASILGG